ncbi:hypothetical protein [Hymenobacter psychrotolerans]|uniref:Uncharacterized protein n=1 Tax=Hymenobacter psychrotolerans DSM 18569 TaxID=1121959 RepID=A0A1M6PPI2_9BACT|nr:hypothetical protein [Hymenobacter psychrotolerans]SHK09829.1 hypothetical protein SAMN02746009_00302 [Hymenobacter psychrotolerans DSM 18569]
MKTRFFSLVALAAVLTLGSCGNAEQRTDGTAGTVVTDIDSAAAEGGVQADATVIDNDAGPTVTADANAATTDSVTTQP